jgi:hypothetical protein
VQLAFGQEKTYEKKIAAGGRWSLRLASAGTLKSKYKD